MKHALSLVGLGTIAGGFSLWAYGSRKEAQAVHRLPIGQQMVEPWLEDPSIPVPDDLKLARHELDAGATLVMVGVILALYGLVRR